MGLARAANFERDIRERQFLARQQSCRAPEAAADDVLVRRDPSGQFEGAPEREWIQADGRSDLGPLELRIQVIVDEADGAAQRVPWQLRVWSRRFAVSLNCRISHTGHDRLDQVLV